MNKKKLISLALAVATLGSLTVTPVNAIIDKDIDDPSIVEWYEENAVTEAIIYLDDAGEDTGTYYWKNAFVESSIDLSSLSEEDTAILNNFVVPIKIDDYSIDISAVEKIITVNKEDPSIAIDDGYYYTNMCYDYYSGYWAAEESSIQKNTIGDSTATDDDTTLGDSTAPSETTLQRGDVNGDGKINAVDLLQLKKYILGLIDSLD